MAIIDKCDLKIGVTFTRCSECERVEAVHAKWKLHDDGSATCSNCRRRSLIVWDFDNHDNFCRHCGAKMDGGNNNEMDSM